MTSNYWRATTRLSTHGQAYSALIAGGAVTPSGSTWVEVSPIIQEGDRKLAFDVSKEHYAR